MNSNKSYITLLISLIVLIACKKNENQAEQKPPEYTKPGYTITESNSIHTPIQFIDITEDAGLDFIHQTGAFGKKWMPETMGSGGGFLDYNNDGLPDIFLVNSSEWPGHETNKKQHTPKLYRNLGNGQFRDVTIQAGLGFSIYGMGCTFADYDSDGDLDIYLTAVGDNKLLRNDEGKFTDVTAQAGVFGNSDEPDQTPAWSTSAAWVDVDRDGRLDLFVCNYVKWTPETDLFTTLDGTTKSYSTPEQYEGETCRLYRNINGNRFEDITKKAGVFNPEGKSLGVAIADFNDDGWPDIVVTNDTQPNFLYLNQGNGTFTDIALRAGMAYDEFGRARAGMGLDVADIKNNGNLSIAIGNFSREPISLYTQISAELFQDFAGSARLTKSSLLPLTFGILFADFDLDGYVDLITGNGHIEPEINSIQQEITFAQAPLLFHNNTLGQFIDISNEIGKSFTEPIVARGIATADIDQDGDLDVLITVNGGSPKLFRNDLQPEQANWLKITLEGNKPNFNAVGAAVTIWAGGLKQKKMVRTGSSYLSQSDFSTLIFGLGKHTQTDSLEIWWPTTGKVTRLGPAAAGKTYVIQESNPVLAGF
ncbi:MAG: CRTAC1 family protein [Caldithrix sp.]|nr:MAG: CRTAC1 family protein [Caldithrix sp.]